MMTLRKEREGEGMNETQRIAYILKQAWELAFDIAVRTMPIKEAQNEAWMKVGGSVKLMIESGYMQHKPKHHLPDEEGEK